MNGVAAGAGFGLALACDLRIASATARFAASFSRLGLHPDWGTSFFLTRLAGAADAGFSAYRTSGAANIFVLDLLTGVSRRITRMEPGQYALFPHYRSDGWIYFTVRDSLSSTREYVVASDATLVSP